MTAFFFILLIALLGLGTMNDIKTNLLREACKQRGKENAIPSYNLLAVLAAGMAAIVGLIAMMLGSTGTAVAALVIAVLVTLPYLIKAGKDISLMKKANWSGGVMMKYQPWWVWGRIVLLGMGKWMHVLMCITIIGIPLYNMMKQVTIGMDTVMEQIQLRQEYEQLHGGR